MNAKTWLHRVFPLWLALGICVLPVLHASAQSSAEEPARASARDLAVQNGEAPRAQVYVGSSQARANTDSAGLSPVYTWVGLGLTGALGIASLISAVDARSYVDEYNRAAGDLRRCAAQVGATCDQEMARATARLEAGQRNETRTNVLLVSTGVAALGTAVVALFLTDWSSKSEKRDALSVSVAPSPSGVMSTVKLTF